MCTARQAGWAILFPLSALAGAYIATFLGESAWELANFHLGNRAWLHAVLCRPTRVDATFLNGMSGRSRAQVHFVHVAGRRDSQAPPDPASFNEAQRCALEAALRASPQVVLWLSGIEPHSHVLDRARARWAAWRGTVMKLRNEREALGQLAVRLHRFHPNTTIGSWLKAHGIRGSYKQEDWLAAMDAPGWPHPAIITDLIRLDILESEGGIYLDLDVVILQHRMVQLPDGIARQAASLPWQPIPLRPMDRRLHLCECIGSPNAPTCRASPLMCHACGLLP
jgi:hypothetical protein